jgi:3-deoxy-7-phosphoheptulonate synthase
MAREQIADINVLSEDPLRTPRHVKQCVPLPDRVVPTVLSFRGSVERILDREDRRTILIVGPCSVHDISAAREYAIKLRQVASEVDDTFFILMRVYFAKPRTTVGWKGFINDPYLDDSFRIDDGLLKAREFLVELGSLGVPVAMEALDSITPQCSQDHDAPESFFGDQSGWSVRGFKNERKSLRAYYPPRWNTTELRLCQCRALRTGTTTK